MKLVWKSGVSRESRLLSGQKHEMSAREELEGALEGRLLRLGQANAELGENTCVGLCLVFFPLDSPAASELICNAS